MLFLSDRFVVADERYVQIRFDLMGLPGVHPIANMTSVTVKM
jgi:hypothetical protein